MKIRIKYIKKDKAYKARDIHVCRHGIGAIFTTLTTNLWIGQEYTLDVRRERFVGATNIVYRSTEFWEYPDQSRDRCFPVTSITQDQLIDTLFHSPVSLWIKVVEGSYK